MPPQQQADDCFLYDHDDTDVVVNFDDFTPIDIVGSDNQIVAMKDESTKQAAHRFGLLDDKDEQEMNCHKTCLFPYLFPFKKKRTIASSISEEEEIEVEVEVERHVRFIEEVIEHWEDTNDGRQRIATSRVLDAVNVIEIEIPHFSDYTEEEKRSMWYTRQEMIQMKQLCMKTVRDMLTQHQQQHQCSAVESLYCCSFYLRGLEKIIDYPQIMTMNHNYNCSTNSMNSTHYVRTTHKTNLRRYDGIIAVLGEQYQQRVECVQHHRKVQKGIVDPDRLRTVYETAGKTQESLQEAQYLATHDERHVQEYCLEQELLDSSSSLSSSSTWTSDDVSSSSSYYSSSEDTIDHDNDDDDDPPHLHHHILMKSILRKLITPFVEVPQGDVYLGIKHAEWMHAVQ